MKKKEKKWQIDTTKSILFPRKKKTKKKKKKTFFKVDFDRKGTSIRID